MKARGCRRKTSKLPAASQLLVYSDMTFNQRGDFLTLNEAEVLDQFWSVRQDIELLAAGSYFCEVLEATAQEGQEAGDLLAMLLNSLYALDTLKKPKELVKAAFELRLLCLTGYEPLIDACAVCGKRDPAEPRLNLTQGVLHCAACRHEVGDGVSMPLPPPALAAARHIVLGNPKKLFSFRLDENSLKQLGEMTEAFLMTQQERGFRTLDYYKQITQH